MKDKIIEKLARLDGYVFSRETVAGNLFVKDEQYCLSRNLPAYLDPQEGHGHLQRLIDGLVGDDLWLFAKKLERIVFGHELCEMDCKLYTATVEQKAEAILRAKGMWIRNPLSCLWQRA